jgi:hypothetical protein
MRPIHSNNFCSFLGWDEFERVHDDLGEAIGKTIEVAAARSVEQCATEHLQDVLGDAQ